MTVKTVTTNSVSHAVNIHKGLWRAALLAFGILTMGMMFGGCSGKDVTISHVPPKKYEVLGAAKGTGNGSLGLLATAYNVIPMGLNTRVENAYENAVKSVEGATGLINVSYQEDWFWWIIGTNRAVNITGDAIREVE